MAEGVGANASMEQDAALEPELRSARFRAEREASWKRLEELLKRLESSGPSALSPAELMEAPQLYRSTLSSLSVAKSYVFDAQLVAYLEGLATRAHFLIYAPRERFFGMLGRLIGTEIPRAVRSFWVEIFIATAVLFLGVLVGRSLVLADPELFGAIMPQGLAGGRSPEASTAVMRDSIDGSPVDAEALRRFALFLVSNNVVVALTAFGFGIALGVPTLLVLFYNGAALGAMLAAFALHDLEPEFIAWLTVHGTTELTAIVIAGGGGLAIAGGMLFPPPRRAPLASAAAVGRKASLLALIAILMLFVAALLESFVRETVVDSGDRVLIGLAFAGLWAAYFIAGGRRGEGTARLREARHG